nr:HAMP domain-containing sensor histidine kinase [Motilibacter deserti]
MLRLDTDPALVTRFAASAGGDVGVAGTARGEVRYVAVPVTVPGAPGRGTFVAAVFRDAEAREVGDVVRVLLGVGLAALAVSAAVAWVLAGRLLRPVRLVRRAAAEITDSDLSRRIPLAGAQHGGDDVAELARTFNHMLDRLEAGFAAQRRFVDDAGHELRTPLTVVSGQLELMGDDPAERAETLEVVHSELDRMARIVNDLELLTSSERAGFVRRERVDVDLLLEEVLLKASTLGDRAWAVEARPGGEVDGDPQRLTQALLQLAANAVQHTGPGDPVWIGGRRGSGTVELWVRDSGPGVPADERDRVFERFARGRSSARRSDGAGLGLSIVRAIARAHSGDVSLHTPTGGGAEFRITLPDSHRGVRS